MPLAQPLTPIARRHIRLILDRARARHWHRMVVERLEAAGLRVSIALAHRGPSRPASLQALLTLEHIVYRHEPGGAGMVWDPIRAPSPDPVDLIADLRGVAPAPGSPRTLWLHAGVMPLEEACALAVLQGFGPTIFVGDTSVPDRMMRVAMALEAPFRLQVALDEIGLRLAHIVTTAIMRALQNDRSALDQPADFMTRPFALGDHWQALTGRVTSAIARLTQSPPHWFVGWRRTQDDGVQTTLRMPPSGWQRMPDDGMRFYADPFVMAHQGRHWLLVEEYPYATSKAVLSAVEIGAEGPVGTPTPFLEDRVHLSYPFVFRHGDAIYLIPESAAARQVRLYRAIQFPWSWEMVAVLIEGCAVADATLLVHEGRFWLFGTLSDPGYSGWDSLGIWSAAALTGPWHAQGDGPVLIDRGLARPAGAVFSRQGALWRPVQDCTERYGGALVLTRIDVLRPDQFRQTIGGILRPAPQWPGAGLHTLNADGGFEVVDGCRLDRRG